MNYIITDFSCTSDLNEAPKHKVSDEQDLIGYVRGFVQQGDAFFELNSPDNDKLTVGINGMYGCVQFTNRDLMPPYLFARTSQPLPRDEGVKYLEFNVGGTSTPIPRAHCLTHAEVEKILVKYFSSNSLPELFEWEDV